MDAVHRLDGSGPEARRTGEIHSFGRFARDGLRYSRSCVERHRERDGKLKSFNECVTTHQPNALALKMNGA